MDNAELVDVLTQTERNSLLVLSQAVNDCQQDVLDRKPGAGARLIKAQETLGKFKARFAAGSASQEAPPEIVGNILEVEKYLVSAGWKIKKSKLYADKKRGLLKVRPDGKVTKPDADAYAAAHLAPADAAPDQEPDDVLKARRDLLLADLEVKQQIAERHKLRLAKEKGELVSRAELDEILVAGVSVFRSGLRQWIYVKMGELVELVGGDPGKIEEAIHFFLNDSNVFFNGFSKARTFDVVDADEDEPDAPDQGEAAA